MDPLVILLIGMVIVIGGVLLLRLHAFLALTLAGLTVAMLTPSDALEKYATHQVASEKPKMTQYEADVFVKKSAIERYATQVGVTCGKIAILIAMAAIIGKCLLDSGAADRIVRSTLRLVGEPRAPMAFIGSGFLLGVPVFFDTVFYLMMPLGKAMRLRTGGNYLLFILCIVAGATMAHSLVPPTPGPLFVASELNINIGVMILAGTIVGLFSSSMGYVWARFANRMWEVPLRDSPDAPLAELEELSKRDESSLPPLWLSLMPIVLPVLLITALTAFKTIYKGVEPTSLPTWAPLVQFLGNKNIALIIAAAIALLMVAWQKRSSRAELTASVQMALASGGVIILITAAGGGFGGVLRQTGIADRIQEISSAWSAMAIIPIAFFVTTLIRTAQGSATVAMLTAVGIVGPLVDPTSLHPVYVALAIGCGSKPIAWMNDSGFWVICKMSGMTEAEGLKFVTPMSIIMGLTGLVVTMIGAALMPMAVAVQ